MSDRHDVLPPDAADDARAYLRRWAAWLAAHPDADRTDVSLALQNGDPPPDPPGPDSLTAVIQHPEFDDSLFADTYYSILHAVAADDPSNANAKKISIRVRHRRIAMWAAWEAHRGTRGLLEMVGLPKTRKALGKLIGISERTIRNYQDKYGSYAETGVSSTVKRLLGKYRTGAVEALGTAAVDKNHKQFAQTAKIFFEMTGDLKNKLQIDLNNLSELSDKELDELSNAL